MDPDQPQEPSDLGLHCLSKGLPMTKAYDLCCIVALKVNKCNSQDFHEMHAYLRSSNSLLTVYLKDRI